jgi:esterase/lipase superfamily enzyme
MLWQEQHQDSPCYKRMHLLAHSMGNRVLMKCLHYFASNYGNHGVPLLFKNLFLAAADIPNHALEKSEEGYWITQAANKVHCFYAADDLAMPASKVMNVANRVYSRRLGHTGPEDSSKVASHVVAVDCNGFNSKVDFPAGHTYFLPGQDGENLVWERVLREVNGSELNV